MSSNTTPTKTNPVRYRRVKKPSLDKLKNNSDSRLRYVYQIEEIMRDAWKNKFYKDRTTQTNDEDVPDQDKKTKFNQEVNDLIEKMKVAIPSENSALPKWTDNQIKTWNSFAISMYANYLIGDAVITFLKNNDISKNDINGKGRNDKGWFTKPFQCLFVNWIASTRLGFCQFTGTDSSLTLPNIDPIVTDMEVAKNRIKYEHLQNHEKTDFKCFRTLQHMHNYFLRRIISDWVGNKPYPLEHELLKYEFEYQTIWDCFMLENGITYDKNKKRPYSISNHNSTFSLTESNMKGHKMTTRRLCAFDKEVYYLKRKFLEQKKLGHREAISWLKQYEPSKKRKIKTVTGVQDDVSHNPFLVFLE